MEGGSQRKWVSSGLLAIIVPMGLLVGFKLTGIITEPHTAIAETTVMETVQFAMEKPTYLARSGVWTRNDYQNEEVQTELGISLGSYTPPYLGNSGSSSTGMNVTAVANVSLGFVSSMRFRFHDYYLNSHIALMGGRPNSRSYSPYFYTLENLTLEESEYSFDRWWLLGNDTRAYIKAKGINQPSQTRFSTYLDWHLTNPLNQTHQLEITLALTYWNTSCYKELVLPIVLSLQPDGSSFEDASELTFWTYMGFSCHYQDREDYYKVWLEQSQELQLKVAYPYAYNLSRRPNPQVDMHIYNSNLELKAASLYAENPTARLIFITDSTGWWYIQISRDTPDLSRPIDDGDYVQYTYILNLSISQTGG